MKARTVILAGMLAAVLPVAATPVTAATGHHVTKCAKGRVTAHKSYKTSAGKFLVEATQKNEFEFFVCTISPTFKTTTQEGVNLPAFGDGSTFKQDSLGHVFYQLQPGQVSGVGVVVFDGKKAHQLGIYAQAEVIKHKHKPFAILVRDNDCNPDCASGHVTKSKLHWNAKHQDYR
jgi:hypothetical protein